MNDIGDFRHPQFHASAGKSQGGANVCGNPAVFFGGWLWWAIRLGGWPFD
jgi:hypothetical protein